MSLVRSRSRSTSPVVTRVGTGAAGAGLLGVAATVASLILGVHNPIAVAIAGLASGGVTISGLVTTALHHNKALEHDAAIAVHDVGPKVLEALKTVDRLATADVPGLAAAQTRLENELGQRLSSVEGAVAGVASQVSGQTVTAAGLQSTIETTVRKVLAGIGGPSA